MTAIQNAKFAAARMHCLAGRYLTFAVGQQSFGIPATQLRDIYWLRDLTGPARSLDHSKGIMTLNGRQVPLLDFRIETNSSNTGSAEHARMVIVESRQQGVTVLMGLIIDCPCQVVAFGPAHIEAGEAIGTGRNPSAEFLLGTARRRGVTTILIDVDHIAEIVAKGILGIPLRGMNCQTGLSSAVNLESATLN